MIPRSIFSKIMNEKAAKLLKKCAPDKNTSTENIKTSLYPTYRISYYSNPNQTFSIDTEKAQANQASFYDIIAELEDEIANFYIQTDATIIHRNDKIPNIRTIDLAPNDIENRLEQSALKFNAVRDLKLIDQFVVGLIASDPVALIAPDKNKEHPNSTTILLSDISLQKIEEAKQRLRAKRPQNSYHTFNSDGYEYR